MAEKTIQVESAGLPQAKCRLCGARLSFHWCLSPTVSPWGPANNVFIHPRSDCDGSAKIIGALGLVRSLTRDG
jgi:hypothetical protein